MSSRRPVVSVVIPSFKQTHLLRAAVESLATQDLPRDDFEAIVVDSSPTDDNFLMVQEFALQAPISLRCLRKEPEGPGPSRNLGVASTTGEFIAFMDSDCFASPGWLRAGLAAFEEGIGIVQGRVMPDPSGTPSNRTWHLQVEKETPYYETANVFYRRSAFEQCGGFPHDLHPRHDKHMGGEDVVAAWNVIRNGWKTKFCSDALVHHALVPIPLYRTLFIKHLFVLPWLVRMFPELRQFMYARYFLSQAHPLVGVLALGVLLSPWHPAWLLLALPYLEFRLQEPAGSLRGSKRILRVLAFLTRDLASFIILGAGSVRYRRVLL